MINRHEIYKNLNDGLKDERSASLRRNLEKNISLICSSGGLWEVVPDFSGKHVVIIGAGPSLDRNICYLKKYSSRLDYVYLAADMALRPLLLLGIKPEYVITCETTPTDFFSGLDTRDIHLLAFSCSSASNIRKWKGKISFYNWMIEGEPYTELWNMAGRDIGSVATGSIVTTQAVSIVLGCNVASLLLVGNDMGFYDRFYAAGSVNSDRRLLSSGRFNPDVNLEMNTVRKCRHYEIRRNGKLFYTNHQFLAAKYWLEDLFKKNPYPVVDCSIPGCSESIVVRMELKDYFDSVDKKRRRGRK